MQRYLEIVKDILDNGEWKTPERVRENCTLTRTKTLTHVTFQHDMRLGFPIATTRKMPWKTMKVELEAFINGITSKDWYKERGCHIWDKWANPVAVKNKWIENGDLDFNKERFEIQLELNDLGPCYGWQMRRFGQFHSSPNNTKLSPLYDNEIDQLATIVNTLKNRPNDRRMICSYWNPVQSKEMALLPCGYSWGVQHVNGYLDLFYVFRSNDFLVGNAILSFGLLLSLLAKTANLTPRKLTGLYADCHIYENQIEGAKILLQRTPKPLPQLILEPNCEDGSFDIFKWTHKDAKLLNYNPDEPINFGEITV